MASGTFHTFSDNFGLDAEFINAITAAANNGTGVDTLGYRRAVAVFITSPSGSGTTSDCKLQESSAGVSSGMADCSPAAAFTQGTTVGGLQVQYMNINLAAHKRYLRLVHTGAGGSAAGSAAGIIILGEPAYAAATQTTAAVSF